MPGWFSILFIFLFFICLEEAIYYTINRYLFSARKPKRHQWRKRMGAGLLFLKKKKLLAKKEPDEEKSSQ